MNRIVWIAAAALLAATSAHAQTTYEPAIPRGITDSPGPQSRELAQPASMIASPQIVEPVVPKLETSNYRHQSDSDARRCLQLASNRQIMSCAERYRSHAARASLRRTKAAKPAEASSARADVGKADLSKAAGPAKAVDTSRITAPTPSPTPPPTSAAVVQKPSATPAPAPAAKPVARSDAKPPKWTDTAKGIVKSQGDHLPD
jgi:hypothetical protein